jgi:hypothetical protein
LRLGGLAQAEPRSFLRRRPDPQRLLFTDAGSQQKVVAQRRVIVQIFVARTEREKPLAYGFLNGVLHAGGVAFIPEACSQSAADSQPGVYLLQEQGASVAGGEASGEIGDNLAGAGVLEKESGNPDTLFGGGWKLFFV